MAKSKSEAVLEDRNRKMDQVAELEKKLDAADTVNRNLQAIKKELQVKNAGYRNAIVELEETLKKKVKAPSKLLSSEAHRLRNREVELMEIVTALKHDLELAKAERYDNADEDRLQIKHLQDCNAEWKKTYQSMKGDLKQAVNVKDLYEDQLNALRAESAKDREESKCEIERLIGEIRGANFCFQKLTESLMFKGGS